jgi:iodotyrosine deiodinase
MNFFEIIKKHKSVSRFSNKSVSKDKIDRIVKAALQSNSGNAKSALKIMVVSNAKKKHDIRVAAEKVEKAYYFGASSEAVSQEKQSDASWQMPYLEEAPYLVVICGPSGQPYWAASTWLALGNLLLATNKEGLGSRCYTPTMATYLHRILNISPKFMPVAVVPIGYSAEELFPMVAPEEERMLKSLFSGRYTWRAEDDK